MFALAEDAGASLFENDLILLEYFKAVIGKILAEHFALGVDIGVIFFFEEGERVVDNYVGVVLESVEGVPVVFVEEEGL